MYKNILKNLIDDMQNFGYIKILHVSRDIYNSMKPKEREHLESFLDLNSPIKWIVDTEKKNYYKFIYTDEPML